MRKSILGVVTVASVLSAASAFASDSGAATMTPASPDPHEVICKTSNATGSSLLLRRTCMTRIEWQQQDNNNREQITDIQQRSLAVPPHQ